MAWKQFSAGLGAGVVALALLAAPAAPRQDPPDPAKLERAMRFAERGDRALRAGNLRQAEQLYRKATSMVAAFADARLGLGHVAMRRQRFAEALWHFESARDGYGAQGKALLEIQSRRYARARDQIERLQASIDTLQRSMPAMASLEISKLEGQIRRLEAVEPPPDTAIIDPPAEVHFYIGNALLNLGRVDDAIAAWHVCAGKKPGFALVHHNLAVAYWKQGRLEEALAAQRRAEELGFRHPRFKAELSDAAQRAPLAAPR